MTKRSPEVAGGANLPSGDALPPTDMGDDNVAGATGTKEGENATGVKLEEVNPSLAM
eukprot:TRINITY_DN4895_c0_g1_i1.p1 TRINITY_DN4895_c0_g1~~TRINITY_DN4895_c0_g1_i1.p1  ORF type:complete len:57 (-),score=10.30 TRINITY_DN4895_c0_g1_i1:426-596(-)